MRQEGGAPMNDYTFGNFLYALRAEKGMSQSKLGEFLGVTNKAVSKWENGSAKPSTALYPKIAEIFGVTVEELFACKRLEKDCDYERIKNHLSHQKKKYAILSSVFLSLLLILPLLLIEFICVVMGFGLPDDIAGPLGAMGFIFAFIASLTAFIIYRKSFKQVIASSESPYTSRFVDFIKTGLLVTAIAFVSLVTLLFLVCFSILSFSSNFTAASIFLSVAAFVLILLFGAFICFANTKRLLKIKFHTTTRERKRIQFSALPLWGKICYLAMLLLSLFVLSVHILAVLNPNLMLARVISMVLWVSAITPFTIYFKKKK